MLMLFSLSAVVHCIRFPKSVQPRQDLNLHPHVIMQQASLNPHGALPTELRDCCCGLGALPGRSISFAMPKTFRWKPALLYFQHTVNRHPLFFKYSNSSLYFIRSYRDVLKLLTREHLWKLTSSDPEMLSTFSKNLMPLSFISKSSFCNSDWLLSLTLVGEPMPMAAWKCRWS